VCCVLSGRDLCDEMIIRPADCGASCVIYKPHDEALARVGPQRQKKKTHNCILSHFTIKISALRLIIQDLIINIYTSYQNFPIHTNKQHGFLKRIFLNFFLNWNNEDSAEIRPFCLKN